MKPRFSSQQMKEEGFTLSTRERRETSIGSNHKQRRPYITMSGGGFLDLVYLGSTLPSPEAKKIPLEDEMAS